MAHKSFMFENTWLTELGFKEFVDYHWLNCEHYDIIEKMDACGEEMLKWSKNHCYKVRKEIDSICKQIDRARHHVVERNFNYFTALKRSLNSLLIKDDSYWKQGAKAHWNKDCDLNTRFFHITATVREKINTIKSLTKENGEVTSSTEGMFKAAHDYFIDLFQKKPSSRDRVIQAIATSISDEGNFMLTDAFTIEEFKYAIFPMQADKSLGPYGSNPGFYHQF
ncbi:uncharacterized protein LOC131613180 [Vicia villosa]|uniref:uncharacterized protein LOC131613180 n=1 Tax=Vicia villosa TaxID=3911 RepID=UPI00273B5A32|nr:uncharacterized protein LOC131613180 [Vicia villosa]